MRNPVKKTMSPEISWSAPSANAGLTAYAPIPVTASLIVLAAIAIGTDDAARIAFLATLSREKAHRMSASVAIVMRDLSPLHAAAISRL